MKTSIKFSHLFLAILLNLLLLLPFLLIWVSAFVLVFFGISGVLSGLFLIFSYLAAFRINLIPNGFYEHALLLFAYSSFFIGTGGLLLAFMSKFVPFFLSITKKYCQWTLKWIGGPIDEN